MVFTSSFCETFGRGFKSHQTSLTKLLVPAVTAHFTMQTLTLFNAVIASETPQEARYSIKHGIVIDPYAAWAYDSIIKWYEENQPDGDDLNKSFFKSWKDAESTPLETRLALQVAHYFSTYGLEALNLADNAFIFTPNLQDGSAAPKKATFRIIKGLPKEVIIERCFKLLNSSALKRETIDLVFDCLEQCSYKLTGKEQVSNKEAKALIYKKTGTLPVHCDELFRYLVYDATGESLVIKNDKLINLIVGSGYQLRLNNKQRKECAKAFNRYKPLWLAFKKCHENNRGIVNDISRLSKTLHKPLPVNVLGSVTSKMFTREELAKAVETAPLATVVRAINACQFYAQEGKDRAYRIRNGKLHCREKACSLSYKDLLAQANVLADILRRRVTPKKIYVPENLSVALPTSEKNFVGNYPTGTAVSIPKTDEHLLVGIYWEGRGVDIDLSATSTSKVGWNSSWSGQGLMYSGDITSAPNGAAEWLYAKDIDDDYIIQVNLFRGPADQKFKLIIGYGSNVDNDYMIDPNKIVFSADCQFADNQMVLGVLKEIVGTAVFFLANARIGGSRVSGGNKEQLAKQAMLTSLGCMSSVDLLHHEVDTPEEADIDLTNPDRDTILSLLS